MGKTPSWKCRWHWHVYRWVPGEHAQTGKSLNVGTCARCGHTKLKEICV